MLIITYNQQKFKYYFLDIASTFNIIRNSMNKSTQIKIALLQFLCAFCFGIHSNLITAQNKTVSVSVLKANFINPPAYLKPFVYWHWMGSNFSKAVITHDLWPEQTYRSAAYCSWSCKITLI